MINVIVRNATGSQDKRAVLYEESGVIKYLPEVKSGQPSTFDHISSVIGKQGAVIEYVEPVKVIEVVKPVQVVKEKVKIKK